MGRNVIVSEETVRDLLEAHASLSAWYYELWGALRAAKGTARPPDDAARAAFVERLADEFPEVAAVARAIRVPRAYVPAPPRARLIPSDEGVDEPATVVEPAPARVRDVATGTPEHAPPSSAAEAQPPPLVDPASVRYR